MTPSDLRERVARAMYDAYVKHHPNGVFAGMSWEDLDSKVQDSFYVEADAAIALVLEEAAKVCDEHAARYEEDMQICDDDGTLECVAAVLRGRAAAIRALKEKP